MDKFTNIIINNFVILIVLILIFIFIIKTINFNSNDNFNDNFKPFYYNNINDNSDYIHKNYLGNYPKYFKLGEIDIKNNKDYDKYINRLQNEFMYELFLSYAKID